MLIIWVAVFVVSLALVVKGADWLLDSSEKIGLAIGLSPFIVGVTIVGFGTSCPELISSIVAVIKGVPEIVAANAIGSNIANILLVVGVSAIVGHRLAVTQSLIDLDLPLLASSTVIFAIMAWDRQIVLAEAIILIITYSIYLLYTITSGDGKNGGDKKKDKVTAKDIFLLIFGIAGLLVGAQYLIESVIKLSEMLSIGTGVISLFAVALGTSLPELLVSAKAAMQRRPEVALGNIFGSNIFNLLVVIGVPGIFKTLPLDEKTFMIGLPVVLVATLLFVISGISKRIHVWEGAMYLVIYLLFISKIFNIL